MLNATFWKSVCTWIVVTAFAGVMFASPVNSTTKCNA